MQALIMCLIQNEDVIVKSLNYIYVIFFCKIIWLNIFFNSSETFFYDLVTKRLTITKRLWNDSCLRCYFKSMFSDFSVVYLKISISSKSAHIWWNWVHFLYSLWVIFLTCWCNNLDWCCGNFGFKPSLNHIQSNVHTVIFLI